MNGSTGQSTASQTPAKRTTQRITGEMGSTGGESMASTSHETIQKNKLDSLPGMWRQNTDTGSGTYLIGGFPAVLSQMSL